MIRRRCVWCREPLVHRPGEPWVHEATGEAYVTRVELDQHSCRQRGCAERHSQRFRVVDDHCALPDWSDSGALPQGASA